ncbi:MAG: TonB-dependent receptor [Saprospiraceae bacterium]|nr:TonB-dependent receptor [Saprospiraceae bacterium]
MKKIRLLALLAACCAACSLRSQQADSSSTRALGEVLVTGVREESMRNNTLNISAIDRRDIERSGAQTLCNALARIPGVARLGTGVGIAKPVVRGMYGNRVLVLLNSLKFDNQQWQDEHGLGLQDYGVGRVELIKGPASILYGSEAVGGVINILEERPDPALRRQGDAGIRLFANTLGISADAGIAGNTAHGWWRLRVGADSHADYNEGGGERVLNSRFGNYALKATLARENGRHHWHFHFASLLSNFGFILGDTTIRLERDGRFSRGLSGPHHTVLLNMFSVQHSVFGERSVLKINAGLQSNIRLEDEGGGSISLNMHLNSLPYNVQWIRPLDRHNELIVSHIGALENNTNYGGRITVPDANLIEEGLSVLLRRKTGRLVLEAGAGLTDKFIQTLETRSVNTPDKELRPFSRNRLTANALLGMSWNPAATWNLKSTLATGFRAPNLAELSSDGLHEGIFRYEKGTPGLNNEQNLNLDLGITYSGKVVTAGISVFVNRFFDYIFLAPTGKDTLGIFPLYRYRQDDALLWGGEAFCTLKTSVWQWANTFSCVRGERDTGTPLPFIPAPRWVTRVSWTGAGPGVWAYVEGEYAGSQDRPAEDESPTDAWFLLNAGFGCRVGKMLSLSLTGRNLLDRRYFDHLSRFKNYPVPFYDQGIDLVLSARLYF